MAIGATVDPVPPWIFSGSTTKAPTRPSASSVAKNPRKNPSEKAMLGRGAGSMHLGAIAAGSVFKQNTRSSGQGDGVILEAMDLH